MSLLTSIERRRLQPDRYTFTSLLMACGRTNNSEQVDFIMGAMKMAGVQPDEIAYGAAIDAHRRAGMLHDDHMIQSHLYIYRHDVTHNPPPPPPHTHTTPSRVVGNSLKAVACLNDMRKNNLEPSASHYNLVIRTLRAEVWIDCDRYR